MLCMTCVKADVSCPIFPLSNELDSCIEYKPKIWEHHCKVERTIMYVGNNEECNWCGREEKDENHEFGKLDKGIHI